MIIRQHFRECLSGKVRSYKYIYIYQKVIWDNGNKQAVSERATKWKLGIGIVVKFASNIGFAIRGAAYCQLQLRKGVHLLLCRNSRSCSCRRVDGACAREGRVKKGGWWKRRERREGVVLSFSYFTDTFEIHILCLLDY